MANVIRIQSDSFDSGLGLASCIRADAKCPIADRRFRRATWRDVVREHNMGVRFVHGVQATDARLQFRNVTGLCGV